MFAIIIGLIVIALVVTLLLKGYYPQAILFMGGVLLLTCTAIFGWGDLLNAKQTTNFHQKSVSDGSLDDCRPSAVVLHRTA